MALEPKIQIGNRYKENLERIKNLVELAVGNSSLKDFIHIYKDNEKKIVVKQVGKRVVVGVYYEKGLLKREIHSVPYDKLV